MRYVVARIEAVVLMDILVYQFGDDGVDFCLR